MSDLEQRVKVLENKVKLLEETLETLKNMNLSEQMGSYIQTKSRSLKIIDLVNSLDNESRLDFDKERKSLNNVQTAKLNIDAQIAQALKNAGTFSDDFPDDLRLFNYEVETGYVIDHKSGVLYKKIRIDELTPHIEKGIRITSYNGFDSKKISIPKEIDGMPVVSIGENAFKNASVFEILLPSSVRAILNNAFEGCKNLKHIDLPNDLTYIGDSAFSHTGLESIVIPDAVQLIGDFCFCSCKKLSSVVFGNSIRTIGSFAFNKCTLIRNISLPETLNEIKFEAFYGTSISVIVFPSNVKMISDIFDEGIKVTYVFLGKDTIIQRCKRDSVKFFYCLPGSNIQKYAREHNIPMKPLSELKMEDYQ